MNERDDAERALLDPAVRARVAELLLSAGPFYGLTPDDLRELTSDADALLPTFRATLPDDVDLSHGATVVPSREPIETRMVALRGYTGDLWLVALAMIDGRVSMPGYDRWPFVCWHVPRQAVDVYVTRKLAGHMPLTEADIAIARERIREAVQRRKEGA